MKPTALPEELIRCWEEKDKDGKVKKISLMYRREIPQFRTAFLLRAVELWNTWKLFKQSPPLGQGWGNERGVIVKILQILEAENNLWDAWQRDLEDEKRRR